MSRTKKGKKGPGYDYQAPRPGNKGGCNSPGRGVKAQTHRAERREADRLVRKERDDSAQPTKEQP
mgnify:CR=1 FL=1